MGDMEFSFLNSNPPVDTDCYITVQNQVEEQNSTRMRPVKAIGELGVTDVEQRFPHLGLFCLG